MKITVFYQQSSPRGGPTNTPSESYEARVQKNKVALEEIRAGLKNEVEQTTLMRELGRDQLMLVGKEKGGKVKEIIDKRGKFEDIREVDLLSLKRNGVSLYQYLLTDRSGRLGPIKNEDLAEGQEFIVNFGANKFMHDSVGAGDILPQDVTEISVNGKSGVRDNIGGRPGYYSKEGKRTIYRPIYDGDIIKIMRRSGISEKEREENEKVEDLFYQRKIAEDILRSQRLKTDARTELSYLTEDEYSKGVEYAEQITQEREENLRNQPKTDSEEKFLLYYGRYLDAVCKHLGISQEVMMAIFRKETNNFDPNARNGHSQAHGIGQIIPSTWKDIQNKHLPRFGYHGKLLDRNDIKDQILAASVYLKACTEEKGGNKEKGIMRYFGVDVENFEEAKRINGGVVKVMKDNQLPDTPEGFMRAYVIWLGLTPGNIQSTYDQNWKNKLELSDVLDGTSNLPYGLDKTVKKDGSTWCGMTTRGNAERFGVTFPQIYNSSDALNLYGHSAKIFTNNPNEAIQSIRGRANVIDIVFENTVGSKMGHRACGVLAQDGKWYVYDPYFAVGRKDTRVPVLFETYMNDMLNTQKKILVGVGLHDSDHPSLKQIN